MNIFILFLVVNHWILLTSGTGHSKGTDLGKVYLGGYFAPFQNGSVNSDQAHALAGFLMAIDEVNARSDILPDYFIEFSVKSAIGLVESTQSSIEFATKSFNNRGVDAVVSAGQDADAVITNKIFTHLKKVQVDTVARSALLSVGRDYPFQARVLPSMSYSGMSLQNLVLFRLLGQSKDTAGQDREVTMIDEGSGPEPFIRVVSFATDDFALTKCSDDLNDQTWAVPNYLGQYTLSPGLGQTDFSKEILEAKATGAQIFVLFMDPKTAGMWLEQAYALGLTREGTGVFLNELATVPETVAHISAGAPVEAIMRGVIGIRFDFAFAFLNKPKGQAFHSRWRSLAPTYNATSGTCSARVDSEGQPLFTQSSLCAGLDFSTYSVNGSDIALTAPFTYDATMTLLQAMHNVLYGNGNNAAVSAIETQKLHEALLLDSPGYIGVTGLLEYNTGMIQVNGQYVNVGSQSTNDDGANSFYDFYARGDRELGNHVVIYNFNAAAYRADMPSGGWVPVGRYINEVGATLNADTPPQFRLCGDTALYQEGEAIACPYHVVYNTADNTVPRERPPTVSLRETSTANQSAVLGISILGLIITLFTALVLFLNRANTLVNTIQPVLLVFIFIGAIVGTVRALLLLSPLSEATCKSEIVVGHFAYITVFVSIYAKMWRVNRLMVVSTLKKIKVTTQDTLHRAALVGGLLLCHLVIVVVLGNSKVVYSETDIANQLTDTYFCQEQTPAIQVSLFAAEIVLLVITAAYAWSVRSLPGNVNESYQTVFVCAWVGIVGVAVVVNDSMGSMNVIDERCLVAILFAISVPLSIIALYGQRVVTLLRKQKILVASVHGQQGAVVIANADEKAKLQKLAKDSLRTIKSEDARASLCADQISFWYSTMMAISAHEGVPESSSIKESEVDKAMQMSRSISSKKKSFKGSNQVGSRVSRAGSVVASGFLGIVGSANNRSSASGSEQVDMGSIAMKYLAPERKVSKHGSFSQTNRDITNSPFTTN